MAGPRAVGLACLGETLSVVERLPAYGIRYAIEKANQLTCDQRTVGGRDLSQHGRLRAGRRQFRGHRSQVDAPESTGYGPLLCSLRAMALGLTSNRNDLDTSIAVRKWFSPALYSLQRILLPILQRYARGAVLDAGCGAMPYRAEVGSAVTSYDGLDMSPRAEDVRFVCSVADMAPVPSASYDTVLCSEVLEHVSHPIAAVNEFVRVLRPGGTLIVTVPFLGRLHEEPNDFQRFTEHGLRLLLSDAGFEVELVIPTGSVASFLGHQVSSVIVLPTWGVPIIRWPIFVLNAALVVVPALVLDVLLKPIRRKLPLGYVLVAMKPVD